MSLPKPNGRVETYLSYLSGNTDIELPVPIGREEQYLYYLCVNGFGGNINPEQIQQAVDNYLDKNPIEFKLFWEE